MVQIKNLDKFFKSYGWPLTSGQITLSFGNSIIITGVGARTMTQPSLFIIHSLLVVVSLLDLR